MQRLLLFFLFISLSFFGTAQKGLYIEGTVYGEHNKKLKNALVTVYSDNEEIFAVRTSKKGLFYFELEYGRDYVLAFSKNMYYVKLINVLIKNTSVNNVSHGQKFKAWQVELYPEVNGINTSLLDQPVGEIFFDEFTGLCIWNADYSESIQQELENLRIEIEEYRKAELSNRIDGYKSGIDMVIKTAKAVDVESRNEKKHRNIVNINDKLNQAYTSIPKTINEKVYQFDNYVVVERVVKFNNGRIITYKKVSHAWGGVYYFKNGKSVTGNVFDLETEQDDNYEPSLGG